MRPLVATYALLHCAAGLLHCAAGSVSTRVLATGVGTQVLIKLIHLYRNLEKCVLPKNPEFDGNLHIKTDFLPKT